MSKSSEMKEFKELSLESVKHIQRERKRKESNGLMQLQRQKVLKSVSFFDTSEFQKGAVFYENPKNTTPFIPIFAPILTNCKKNSKK